MKKILLPLLIILLLSITAVSYGAGKTNKIYSYSIKGIITDATHSIVEQSITQAEQENIPLLLYIDTPGGVYEPTRKIVQSILSAHVPVIAYVYPDGARAASAGMFTALSADYTIMSESATIGAAHPVNSDGSDIKGYMADKVLNDTVALAKTIAEKRNKNVEAVTKMVTESKSYTSKEALELNIIDAVASPKEVIPLLAKKYNLSPDTTIINLDPSFGQSLYNLIADPDFLAIILVLGAILIMLEIAMPGSFIFAGLGIVCLIIFTFGANILPINFIGIILIGLGFVLLVAELFLPSFGALTVGGIVSFIFGLKMLFDSEESVGVGVSLWVILLITALILAIVILIGRLVIKDFRKKAASGPESMENKEATVIMWEGNKGKVKYYDEIWNAKSDDILNINDTVYILKIDGLTMEVKKK